MSSSETLSLNLGDTFVSQQFVIVTCHGLGSCVALFLYDINSTNSAGAHIMLPGQFDGALLMPNCYAATAIETLLMSLEMRGTSRANIRAAVIGGANVANITGLDVGKENVSSVMSELRKHNIGIAQMNIGERNARTARFCSRTRRVQVTTLNMLNMTNQN